MPEHLILHCPQNKRRDYFSRFFAFHILIVLALLSLLQPLVKVPLPAFMLYVLVYSVGTTLLLVNYAFRQYTKIEFSHKEGIAYYRYGRRGAIKELMFQTDALQQVRATKSIFGIRLRLTILTDAVSWSLWPLPQNRKIHRAIIISKAQFQQLKAILSAKNIEIIEEVGNTN